MEKFLEYVAQSLRNMGIPAELKFGYKLIVDGCEFNGFDRGSRGWEFCDVKYRKACRWDEAGMQAISSIMLAMPEARRNKDAADRYAELRKMAKAMMDGTKQYIGSQYLKVDVDGTKLTVSFSHPDETKAYEALQYLMRLAAIADAPEDLNEGLDWAPEGMPELML